jgi:hypothetical protein
LSGELLCCFAGRVSGYGAQLVGWVFEES